MSSVYKTIPIFLSGHSEITGYTCPNNKKALVKQIALANESNQIAYVNIKLEDWNDVGLGTSSSNSNFSTYPLVISGLSPAYSVVPSLEEFIALGSQDSIVLRTPNSGRVNAIFTIIENVII